MNEECGALGKLIEVQQVGKRFGAVQALEGVSFSVPGGGSLALRGPSGSGKTTLLRLICGLEEPDRGQVALDGQVVSQPGRLAPPWQRGIGAVFQKPALWPHLTVRQNAAFGLTGWGKQQAAARLDELLEAVDLSKLAERYPYQLSGGEAQRAALLRALAPRPPILLLDEPFANLDPALRTSMLAFVQQTQQAEGATLILVAHDDESAAICTQVLYLEKR